MFNFSPRFLQFIQRLTRPWAIFTISLILHVIVVLAIKYYRAPILWENGMIVTFLFKGQGFSGQFSRELEPTSWQAPGYPYLLLAMWKLFGQANPTGYLTLSLIQALAIASVIFPLGHLTERWFGAKAATWARVIACLMPLYLWYPTRLHHTALVMAMHPWLMWGWVSLRDRASTKNTLLTGIGTGLAGLFQPVILVLFGLISFLLVIGTGRKRDWKSFNRLVIAGLLTLVVLTPWTIRNYEVHHRLLLVKDSFGKEFWMGNNPHASGTAYPAGGGGVDEVTNIYPPKAYALHGLVSEVELMEALQREGMDYVRAEPGAFVKRTFKKILWLWTITPAEYTRSSGGGEARKFGLIHSGYWIAFVALALAARLMGGPWKAEYIWIGALYFVVVSLIYGLTHVGQARYRGEVEFLIIPATAAGCALLWERLTAKRRNTEAD